MKKFGLIALAVLLLGASSLLVWRWVGGAKPPVPLPLPLPTPVDPEPTAALHPRDTEFEDAYKAASRPTVNLLRLPSARLVRSTALPGEAEGLAALTDDEPATVAEATASDHGPLEVVYGFDDRTVTAEAVFVRLPAPGRPGAATGRVELLVSTLSPNAGFRRVRTDPLARTTAGQVFAFPPTGVRWALLRFYPAGAEPRIAVAEVALIGREGPPVSQYAFNESPAKALDVLARLKALTALNIKPSKDEEELFEDAKGGTFKKWTLAGAALLASGVADAEKRDAYLERVAKMAAEASAAVGDARPFEKGDKLLRHLHDGPLGEGYVLKQTALGTLLDERTFNCVSSAVLYNELGRRLKLDVRAIEVPDHAFSIVYDGTRPADVETTTAKGFNPARDAVEELHRKTGFVYLPDVHRDKRREIGDVGLAALVYHNRAVLLAHDRRWHESLGQFFRALSLDPELKSSVKNTLTVLALWSWELAHGGKYEEALQVLATGLELAPRDARLLHNRHAVWTQWAMVLLSKGEEDEALNVLRRAAKEIPDGHFTAMQAWVFIRKTHEPVRAGKWAEAIVALEAAKDRIDETAAEEIRDYRTTLRLRWAHAEMAERRFAKAVDVLAEGLAADAGDRRLQAHLAFAVQEHVAFTHTAEGPRQAREVLTEYLKRFAAVPAMRGVATGYVWAVARGMMKAGDYQGAIDFIDGCAELLADPKVSRHLVLAVYDAWADSLAAKKDHKGAVRVFHDARKRDPKDPELARRAAARLDAAARARAEAGAWDDALALYEQYRRDLLSEEQAKDQLLYLAILWTRRTHEKEGAGKADELSAHLKKKYPTLPDLRRRNRRANLEKLVRELSKAGKYEQALAIIERAGGLLDDEAKNRTLHFALLRELSAGLAGRADREQALALLDLRELETQLRQGLTDSDGAVRAASADVLANLEMHSAVDDLVKRVADDLWVRSDFVNKELNDPEAGGKAAALAALRKLAPAQVTPALRLAMQLKPVKVKWASQHPLVWVCTELGNQKDEEALQGLAQALEHGDGYVRRAAADALKTRGDKAAVPALVKRVADEAFIPRPDGFLLLHDEPYDGLRDLGSKDHALEALKALAPERVTPALSLALAAKNVEVRAWAARELGKRTGPDAIKALLGALADDSYRVRSRAAESLGEKTGSKEAVAALIKALSDRDGYVRRSAADGLKKLGDPSAVPALMKRVADEVIIPRPGGFLLLRDEPYDGVRGMGSKDHALAALIALATAEQVNAALLEAARSGNANVKKWAEQELSKRNVARAEGKAGPFLTEGLSGWEGLKGYWNYKGGELTGSKPNGIKHNTFLCSNKSYTDFELTFKVRLDNDKDNSGLQIRSALADPNKAIVNGYQVEIGGPFWGGIYNEGPRGGWVRRPTEMATKSGKVKEFNDYFIRVVGKKVTVKVNGVTAVDETFDGMPDTGFIAFQIHQQSVSPVIFKDIHFKDLSRSPDRADAQSTPPPKGATVLFDGKSLDGWTHRDGKKAAHWKVLPGGILEVARGGDIMTREKFDGKFRLHVEFRVPHLPEAKGEKRGNSGVYVQGRYEVQILDSYGLVSTKTDCGAIYNVAAPRVNVCKLPMVWQSFDIDFTAPVFKGGKRIEPARMTVYHNGVKVIDDVSIDRNNTEAALPGDASAPGPVLLQELRDAVQFRNIWLLPPPPDSIGQATMQADGTIVLDLIARGAGDLIGRGRRTYRRDDKQYQEILDHIGGLKPGQNKPVPPWRD